MQVLNATIPLDKRAEDLTGQKFNRLTVLSFAGRNRFNEIHWNCICECGAAVVCTKKALVSGRTKSCGCWRMTYIKTIAKKHLTTHGKCKTREYEVWSGMRERCENPMDHKYPSYGARGIKVCERWKTFENFLSDMGPRPSAQHSIDRKDNNGDYSAENCRWATRKEQARNRRDNHFLEFDGKRLTIAEWSELTGIRYDNIKNRINNLGWSVQKTLTTQTQRCRA